MSDLFLQPSRANSVTRFVNKTKEEQFLRFYLHPDTRIMLPIKQVTEVLKIQFGQIVPIPQMPTWIMGVYNWRGEVLWMLDLGNLLSLDSWYQHESNPSGHSVIVLSPYKEKSEADGENIHLGLVVSQVEDIEMCDPTTIQPTSNSKIMAQLQSFLRGYWLKPGGDLISVLDGLAIVGAMPQDLSI